MQGRKDVVPIAARSKPRARKIVLCKKQIGADRRADRAGDDPREPEVVYSAGCQPQENSAMEGDRERRVEMPLWVGQERQHAHPQQEHCEVSQRDRQGMTCSGIAKPLPRGSRLVGFDSHQRIRADIGAEVLAIVSMVMIMWTLPHARWIQRGQAEHQHHEVRNLRSLQNGAVLMVMIEDKESDDRQPRHDAEGEPEQQGKVATNGNNESTERGDGRPQVPPAPPALLAGKRLKRLHEWPRIARLERNRLHGKAARWRMDDGSRVNGHSFLYRGSLRECRRTAQRINERCFEFRE